MKIPEQYNIALLVMKLTIKIDGLEDMLERAQADNDLLRKENEAFKTQIESLKRGEADARV